MRSLARPRRIITIALLTAAWCGLWRELSVANVTAGLVLATAITFAGLGTSGRGSIRIGPLLQFAWLVLVDLVKSTVTVAVEVLTPTDRTDEAVIGVQVPAASRDHLLLITTAITLTPGTAVVDVDPDAGTVYLHLLHHNRRDETVAHVDQLVHLACKALPMEPSGEPT